jgi:hypothetical protein
MGRAPIGYKDSICHLRPKLLLPRNFDADDRIVETWSFIAAT